MVMVIDMVAIDLFLSRSSAIVAAIFTLMNLAGIAWFIREYVALGRGGIAIGDESLHFSVGTVYRLDVPTAMVETATKPTWKDIPQAGMPEAQDFLNLTKQASPNVLLRLRNEVELALPLGRKRKVKRLAMHLDDPDSFVNALTSHLKSNG